MNKKIANCLLSFGVAVIIVACQRQPVISPILEDSTCKPPCWNSIQPGVTKLDEAIEILENTSSVDQATIEQSNLPWNGLDRAFWEFPNGAKGTVYVENNIVSAISFSPIGKSSMFGREGTLGITISDALEKYGAPKSVIVLRGYDGFYFLWFYPDQGLSFSYSNFGKAIANRKEISPNNIVTNINYFDPKRLNSLLEKGWFSDSNRSIEQLINFTYDWKGYGDINEKYPPK